MLNNIVTLKSGSEVIKLVPFERLGVVSYSASIEWKVNRK